MNQYKLIYSEYEYWKKESYEGEELKWISSGCGDLGRCSSLSECHDELEHEIQRHIKWFNAKHESIDKDTVKLTYETSSKKCIIIYKIVDFSINMEEVN